MLPPLLLPGTLSMPAENLNRDADDAALFEIGAVFREAPTKWMSIHPSPSAQPAMPGRRLSATATRRLLLLKGAVEELLSNSQHAQDILTSSLSIGDFCRNGCIPAVPPVR